MSADFIHPELAAVMDQYQLISDCIEGAKAVKAKGTLYLPDPDSDAQPVGTNARYVGYKMRANFYNVAQRTLEGLIGQIFLRNPNIEVPNRLNIVKADVDGAGVTAVQQAKLACEYVLGHSRAGLFVDYPKTEGATTVADLEQGNIRPTIALYHPNRIRNWDYIKVGAKWKLALVVLDEEYRKDAADRFTREIAIQQRCLFLEDGVYKIELWRDGTLFETLTPTGPKGETLDEIPFTFIGVKANDGKVEPPAMYALCDLNISHYRNSADHEEMLFICGQATPVAKGLTAEWAEQFGEIKLGSRSGVLLPVGGEFELVQAEERSAISAEMLAKEKRMVALGAKLVEEKQVQRTATEASQDEAAETSVLSSAAKNVGAAYKFAFEWCAFLVGLGDRTSVEGDSAITFDLNSEFDLVQLSPEERKQLFAEWQGGAITDREYRDSMTRAGIASEDFDEWEKDRDARAEREVANAAAMLETEAAITGDANANPNG
jgi:Domain of unknown function (DUF4055)